MSRTQSIAQVARGFAMGAADIVPGVSGGTIALVTGIYERLIANVHEGASALKALVTGKPKVAVEKLKAVEWLWLIPLGVGLLLAVASLASVIETQLHDHPQQMAGLFFGLVLGSVLVFEVAGPILVKVAVIRSGEVSIVDAVKHKERIASGNQFVAVISEFLSHLGLRKSKKERQLGDMVIKKTQALPMDASFEKITKFIETYQHDSFPIVDKDGFYVGFISFNEIKDAGFDPVMKDLVRAADLITSAVAVDLDDDDIDSAYVKLRDLPNTALPVVKHADDGKRLLVGAITQRELLQAYMEAHKGGA